jgi:ArsR family transcriptional regulator, arsenate/arsenite/antimonite-responsive transcriptional repressor
VTASTQSVYSDDQIRLAELAKALAHPGRLQILQILAQRDSCICGEIVEVMPLAQATVSQHLRELKRAGLIRGQIDGPRTCYCLDKENIDRARESFGRLLQGINCCETIGDIDG